MAGTIEDTVNNLLADFLRHKGFNILSQISANVPSGRRQPDFEITSQGVFFGEGEWQSNYLKGFNQAIEFGDIPGCSGYFLIGYPEELRENIKQARLLSTDPTKLLASKTYRAMFKVEGRPTSLFLGSLEDLPIWLNQSIERKAQLEQPEEFVNLMRDIVAELSSYLPDSGKYPSLFEHIIAYMPKDKGEMQTAKKAAAYLLLNQLVFYRILSAGRGYTKIETRRIKTPSDLKTIYFDEVLEDDYQAVFNFDVASLFPDSSLKFIIDMTRIIEHVEPENFTRDLLGNIFHRLIPQDVRKPVAAYYTNPMAARLLAALAIKLPRDKVADFACGSGTLLMAAYEAKAKLLGREFTRQDHKAFIEQDITGVDIMPFAAHLAVIQLALKNPVYWTDSVRVAVHDSTGIRPGELISSIDTTLSEQMKFGLTSSGELEPIHPESGKKGAISTSGTGKGFHLEKSNVIIMNPPFTRKQFINQDFRNTLTYRFAEYKSFISNEQSYWSYFVLLADRFLEQDGRMALVLPASILRQPSNAGIRKLLLNRYNIRFVISTEYRAAFSESASFREVLLIAQKTRNTNRAAMFCALKVLPNSSNIEDLVKALSKAERTLVGENIEDFGQARFVTQQELSSKTDWFSFLPGEEQRLPELEVSPKLSPLSEVVPKIIQGLRLNRQELEMKPENTILGYEREERTMMDWVITKENRSAIWAVNKDRAIEVKFPRKALIASTRTATGMDKMLLDHVFDYVVNDRFEGDRVFWNDQPADQILVERNRQIRVRSAYLIIAGRGGLNLAAGGTKLLAFCSSEKIAPTWAFWSFKTATFQEASWLCLWWNSTFMLNQLIDVRTEVEGSRVWFGKESIEPLLVIDHRKLSENHKKLLTDEFTKLSAISFPSILEQLDSGFEARTRIDKLVAKTAGISSYGSDSSIRDLQKLTAEKLQSLKSMMGRK